MTEVHKVVCERCGKEADMGDNVFGDENYRKPEKWEQIDVHHSGVTSDLCFECFKDFMAVEEYFFMQKVGEHLNLEDEDLQAQIKTGDDQ